MSGEHLGVEVTSISTRVVLRHNGLSPLERMILGDSLSLCGYGYGQRGGIGVVRVAHWGISRV